MPNDLEIDKGENIHKPYEPDITKGFVGSIPPIKPVEPQITTPTPKEKQAGKQ